MKWLATILSVYFLILLALPCSDEGIISLTYQTEHAENHGHQHSKNDGCSPVCSCSCCNITVTSTDYFLPGLRVPKGFVLSTTNATEIFPIIPRYITSIWQPPKHNA